MKKTLFSLGFLAYWIFSNFTFSNSAVAQITPDGTTNTDVNSADNYNFTIENGDRAGDNLFHSFDRFSVPNEGSAVFNNVSEVRNIFSRVTGGNISNIDGLLGANGNANLFLINPAGVIFGGGARLDIGGSFYSGSADSILFEDGEFSASNFDNPVLSINAPIGFSVRDNPGDVVNRSNFNLTTTVIDGEINPSFAGAEFIIQDATGLEVATGKTIALIGGNVILDNAGAITAPGGNVELGGLSQAGEISINGNGSLTFPEAVAKGDVSLTQQSRVKVVADGGGSIKIDARNFSLTEQSELYGGIAEDVGSVDAQAGDIVVNASESVTITGSGGVNNDPFALIFNDYDTAIRNVVGLRPNQIDTNQPNLLRNPKSESTAVGNAGSIIINSDRIELSDRGSLTAKVYGQGDTGNINIQGNNITLDEGDILNQVISGAGNTGNINLASNNLTLFGSPENVDGNSSFILADTRSLGNAGNINIDVENEFNIEQVSLIQTQVLEAGEGNAGDIKINARTFKAVGGVIQTEAKGEGNPGDLNIDVVGDINFDTVTLNSRLSSIGTGNRGNITISAANFQMNQNSDIPRQSLILAGTSGQGNSGNVAIAVDNAINVSDSFIEARAENDAVGNAGRIDITSNSLDSTNTSFNTQTLGQGDAGDIKINATESIFLNNQSRIESTVDQSDRLNNSAVGNAGNIEIITNNLELNNNSGLRNISFARGNAGNITVRANDSLIVNNNSEFSSDVRDFSQNQFDAVGNAGTIEIFGGQIILKDSSSFRVDSQGDRNGGVINIKSNSLELSDRATISAIVTSGSGGNINLTVANTISLLNNSLISAEAFNLADGGNINIDTQFAIAFPNQVEGNGNDIIASAAAGNGGNITINAESLLGTVERRAIANNRTNDIDASSAFGLDGNIAIDTINTNALEGTTELPQNIVETEQTTAQACSNSNDVGQNTFSIEGRGGIKPEAGAILNSDSLLTSNSSTQHSSLTPVATASGEIIAARGVAIKPNGDLILTPYATKDIVVRNSEYVNCN